MKINDSKIYMQNKSFWIYYFLIKQRIFSMKQEL